MDYNINILKVESTFQLHVFVWQVNNVLQNCCLFQKLCFFEGHNVVRLQEALARLANFIHLRELDLEFL